MAAASSIGDQVPSDTSVRKRSLGRPATAKERFTKRPTYEDYQFDFDLDLGMKQCRRQKSRPASDRKTDRKQKTISPHRKSASPSNMGMDTEHHRDREIGSHTKQSPPELDTSLLASSRPRSLSPASGPSCSEKNSTIAHTRSTPYHTPHASLGEERFFLQDIQLPVGPEQLPNEVESNCTGLGVVDTKYTDQCGEEAIELKPHESLQGFQASSTYTQTPSQDTYHAQIDGGSMTYLRLPLATEHNQIGWGNFRSTGNTNGMGSRRKTFQTTISMPSSEDSLLLSSHLSLSPEPLQDLANKFSIPLNVWKAGLDGWMRQIQQARAGPQMLSWLYFAGIRLENLRSTAPNLASDWGKCQEGLGFYRCQLEKNQWKSPACNLQSNGRQNRTHSLPIVTTIDSHQPEPGSTTAEATDITFWYSKSSKAMALIPFILSSPALAEQNDGVGTTQRTGPPWTPHLHASDHSTGSYILTDTQSMGVSDAEGCTLQNFDVLATPDVLEGEHLQETARFAVCRPNNHVLSTVTDKMVDLGAEVLRGWSIIRQIFDFNTYVKVHVILSQVNSWLLHGEGQVLYSRL